MEMSSPRRSRNSPRRGSASILPAAVVANEVKRDAGRDFHGQGPVLPDLESLEGTETSRRPRGVPRDGDAENARTTARS